MNTSASRAAWLTALGSALALSGCGGGGGGGDAGSVASSNPGASHAAVQITGKAIDGYLAGAKVCLDLNDNGACDAQEPAATTDQNGRYALKVAAREEAIGKKLLVVVTPDTRDLSRPGQRFPAEFTLSHIVNGESEQHVTPLTSLFVARLEAGYSEEEAERDVRELFPKAANPGADFIAQGDSDTARQAAALVDALARFRDTSTAKVDAATVRAVMNAYAEEKDLNQVDKEAVEGQKKRPIFSAKVDAAAALASGLLVWDQTKELADHTRVPMRDRLSLDGKFLNIASEQYQGGKWRASPPGKYRQEHGEYALKADGSWSEFIKVEDTDAPLLLKQVSGNTILASDAITGITSKLVYRAAFLEGKAFSDVLNGVVDGLLPGQISGHFSTGSVVYQSTLTRDQDGLVVPSYGGCNWTILEEGRQSCNFIGDSGKTYQSVDQVFGLDIPVSSHSTLRLAADGRGEVRSGDTVLVASDKIRWSRYARNPNVLVIDISLDDARIGGLSEANLLEEGGQIAVALHNGRLKRARLEPKSIKYTIWQFSPSAFDQFFDEIKKAIGVA